MNKLRHSLTISLYLMGGISIAGIILEYSTFWIFGLLIVASIGFIAWRKPPLGLVHLAAFLFFLILHVQYFTMTRLTVSGISMSPTLRDGDVVHLNRYAYGILCPPIYRVITARVDFVRCAKERSPDRGEIVAIRYPRLDANVATVILKRVIAVGGDRYEIARGEIRINDRVLSEPYAEGLTNIHPRIDQPPASEISTRVKDLGELAVYAASFGLPGKGVVPSGALLVLGDNRENSRDSRSIGFVPLSFVIGSVME